MAFLPQIYCLFHFKGALQGMLVSKIIVKIILKIYGDNSPRGDLAIVICVWYWCSLFNHERLNFTNRQQFNECNYQNA